MLLSCNKENKTCQSFEIRMKFHHRWKCLGRDFFLILIFNFTRLIHNKGIGKASFFVSERVFLGRTKWESHVLNVGGTITNAGILYYLSWRKEGCYWAQTFSWFWILTWSTEMAKRCWPHFSHQNSILCDPFPTMVYWSSSGFQQKCSFLH